MRQSLLVVVAVCASACPRPAEAPPPDGAALFGTRDAVLALVDAATRIEGSRLGQRARALREPLARCALVAGAGTDAEELLERLACVDVAPAWVGPARALVSGTGALVTFGDGAGRLVADLGAADGEVRALARFRERPARGPATLLVPAREGAGRAALSSRRALVHARLRVEGGVDIAAMAPKNSQGAELFGLEAELLSNAVLAGTWELALYAPDDEARVLPPLAFALGIKSRVAGERALAAFVDLLRQRWPIQPTGATLDGRAITCVPNVRILPELAPCAAVLDDALVLGWNLHALGIALEPDADAAGAPARDGVVVRLQDFPAADRLLARARNAEPTPVSVPWPLARLEPFVDERGPGYRMTLTASGAR